MRHAAIILALLLAQSYDAVAYPLYGSEDTGIPLAAGLIVGEALVGVGYSLSIVFSA